MYAVILAGGVGSRLSEETSRIPKPMVEIGDKPMIWHIMKIYSHHGINDFIVCLGYKGHLIKQYFAEYWLHSSDITVDLANRQIQHHRQHAEPWRVTLVDTGAETGTGGRLKAIADYVGSDTFCMTYGDGVSDVNIRQLIEFHKAHGKHATVTAVSPPGRFGALQIEEDLVVKFQEKPSDEFAWINGGFFVLEPAALNYVESAATMWEQEPLRRLAEDRQLVVHRHHGFWHPMDTLREKRELERLWHDGSAPWKIWP
jgi:glucose-1-phosphate cytidylyltransferase